MDQNLHLAFKYQFYAWNREDKSVETLKEHLTLLDKHGSVWWGRMHSIAIDKIEILKRQLKDNTTTYCFLYATAVPKSINQDGNLWYVAKLKDIYVGNPSNKELIPEYYRNINLGIAFLLEDIKPYNFNQNLTPKVPGQASLRYINIIGEFKVENLYIAGTNKKLTEKSGNTIDNNNSNIIQAETTNLTNESENILKDKVISLQNDLIDLQNEIKILNEYKIQYQKILNADYLFNSEKFLETWIEENIHKLADNLIIIDRQPSASWTDGKFGRLDLLAMDKQTKELVIIEVKTRKRSKKSSYDQYLRYTAWARKNLLMIEQTYEKFGIKPTIELAFMIITDFVDEEMTEICKQNGITLLKVFGGLGFEKIT